jgi:hypothetical protein
VTGPIPDLPAHSALQNDTRSFPTGDTTPIPVTTTRRDIRFERILPEKQGEKQMPRQTPGASAEALTLY